MVTVNFQPTPDGSVTANRFPAGDTDRFAVVRLYAGKGDAGVGLYITADTVGLYADLIAYLQDQVAWVRGQLDEGEPDGA